jgi:hypothetical protein
LEQVIQTGFAWQWPLVLAQVKSRELCTHELLKGYR